MTTLRPLLLAAALCVCTPSLLHAQTPPTMFPFVIPWNDSTPGTATDVSFLNAKPAGADGFIIVKNGHFVEALTGRRVRFLGVSFAGQQAFPDHADAASVAARLSKYGVNLVRLHHMDNDNWGQDAHIWNDAYHDYRHIDAVQLDKLDYFIAQLKKNGIYVDINLHVSRQFDQADGFPPSIDQIPFNFDDRVDNYDPRMIALQKEYARQLLTHVNPYTHLAYADDPCVVMVEINNENSLVGQPGSNVGSGLGALPQPFLGELAGDWDQWLANKYHSSTVLKAAWLRGVTPPGPSLLSEQSQWTFENQGTSQMTSAPFAPPAGAAAPDAAPGVVMQTTQVDGTDWHVQSHITGLNLHAGDTYTVSFRAKASSVRTMPVAATVDEADWHNIGLVETASLTPAWQTFGYTFVAHDTVPDHSRIAFTLGGQTGTVWISGLQVKPGAADAGLRPGQSLAAKTVGIPYDATLPQWNDWLTFLADTERHYANGMRSYLKNTLHVHANLIDTQISWGGLSGPYREAKMEYADNHAYWQHPSFPGKPWDPVNWTMPDTPMVADLASGGGGTFLGLAENRIAGKPYSVSEYNEPAPNDYQCEAVPELATFAAYQDWDTIILFDYGSYGTGGKNNKIDGYFGIGSNPAKWAFMPAAALIFRDFEFPKSREAENVILPREYFPQYESVADMWKQLSQNDLPPAFLTKRLSLVPYLKQAFSIWLSAPIPKTAFSHITVKTTPSGPIYIAQSAHSLAITGFVGGQVINTKAATFTFPKFGDNFAAITLTPLDGKPIASSHDMLLTMVGKAENTGMVWNAAHTSVGDNWGHSPSLAEGIPAQIELHRAVPIAGVGALDDTGKQAETVPVLGKAGNNGPVFSVGPQYKTLWYEIKG